MKYEIEENGYKVMQFNSFTRRTFPATDRLLQYRFFFEDPLKEESWTVSRMKEAKRSLTFGQIKGYAMNLNYSYTNGNKVMWYGSLNKKYYPPRILRPSIPKPKDKDEIWYKKTK